MIARFSTLLAVIAMILAAIRLYGTMAYSVAQRTQEIGLRMDQTLFGLERHDPLVMSGAAAILALVAIVAAVVPARAAARVDPLLALRHE